MPNVNQQQHRPQSRPESRSFGCLSIFGIMLLTIAFTVAGTVWLLNNRVFATEFKPVQLNDTEQRILSAKIDAIGEQGDPAAVVASEQREQIQPERYKEDDSRRRIELSQRELNALLAENTDLAEQLGGCPRTGVVARV